MKCLVAAFALLLAGCILPPTQAQLDAADYGPYPDNYEAIVYAYMDDYLRDSESARYKFVNQPGRFGANKLDGHIYGWIVCVDVNAKNKFGAYTGYLRSYFLIHDGRIIDSANTDGTIADSVVQANCDAELR